MANGKCLLLELDEGGVLETFIFSVYDDVGQYIKVIVYS
jgi:hypothetical protein